MNAIEQRARDVAESERPLDDWHVIARRVLDETA